MVLRLKPEHIFSLFYKSILLIKLDRNNEAEKSLDKIIKYGTVDSKIYESMARTLYKAHKYDYSLKFIEECLKIKCSIGALKIKAACLQNLYRYDEALNCLELALTISPSDSKVLNAKGFMLARMLKYDEVLAAYNSVLELNPNDTNNKVTKSSRALILRHLGRYDEAIAEYNKILELNPNDMDSLYRKGQCLIDKKRLMKGLSVLIRY